MCYQAASVKLSSPPHRQPPARPPPPTKTHSQPPSQLRKAVLGLNRNLSSSHPEISLAGIEIPEEASDARKKTTTSVTSPATGQVSNEEQEVDSTDGNNNNIACTLMVWTTCIYS